MTLPERKTALKVVLLLSGGLDSTVLLADRVEQGDQVTAISFDYGQTHRAKELSAARAIARHYNVPHRIVGLSSLTLPSALTGTMNIPTRHAEQPDATTVPARNMLLISAGAAIAEAEGAYEVLIGANADDAAGYVDCRPRFIKAMQKAVLYGTDSGVELHAPYLRMTKENIVSLGRLLGAPIEMSWSCYRGGEDPCMNCGACESRKEAGA